MKRIIHNGLQTKFLILFVISIIGATTIVVLCQIVFMQLSGFSSEKIAGIEQSYAPLYFLGFLTLTSLLFYLSSKPIITRIEKINLYMHEVKKGNFTAQIDTKSADEIGELSRGINEMVRTINHYMDEQKQAEQSKIEMISNISHDLRTPLTSLLGYVELLKTSGLDPAVSQEYMQIIEKKCVFLRNQIQDLLDYSSISQGKLILAKSPICVKNLIEQVMIDFIPEMEKSGMEFFLAFKQEDLTIFADINLFIRLIQNIISNAILYGKSGKSIRIEGYSENTDVLIRVINFGDRILEEDLPFIFERFYRSEKSRNANTGGKGMGLAVAKSIVDLHDGKIKVYSSHTETVFEVIIPGIFHKS